MATDAMRSYPGPGSLPIIGNGSLVVYRQPTNYFSGTCTSLPPLLSYLHSGAGRRRWGEDERIEKAGFHVSGSGFARCRNNFDSCHPVAEVNARVYDGYMFPKPMAHNLRGIHTSPISTVRHIPRNPSCEVFPRNREDRTNPLGVPELSERTRESISTCVNQLYRTSRYHAMFKDTSDFMIRKLERDAQYEIEGPNYVEEQTCSRILNHPDPCNHCWPNGEAIPKAPGLLKTYRQPVAYKSENREHIPCARCGKIECPHKGHCLNSLTKLGCEPPTSSCDDDFCKHCVDCEKCDVCRESKLTSDVTRTDTRKDNTVINSGDTFGPWARAAPTDGACTDISKELWSDIYKYNLPSSMHCPATENELASSFRERWEKTNHGLSGGEMYAMAPWQGVCGNKHRVGTLNQRPVKTKVSRESLLPTVMTSCNTWTYRDGNNIRVPCVAHVIGTLNKSGAHTSHHVLHTDPTPDLRDNHRYSKRVTFFGYNSSVFR